MSDLENSGFPEDEDFSPDLITLSDENGEEQDFEIIDAMEINDKTYLALMPVFDEASEMLDSDGQFIILREDVDDKNEEFYSTIDDKEEFDLVFAAFSERLEDDYTLES